MRKWLEALLPGDAAARCNARDVRLAVTRLGLLWPPLVTEAVGDFKVGGQERKLARARAD